MFRRECRICFAGLAMPVFETPKTEPESKARDRDRDRRRRARHDRGSPDRERRGRERRNRTRERSRSKPAPELGTAPKGAAPAPPRRCCTRTGCSKITSGVWSAYQHMMAVHATGEEGQAEREALWDEACRLWPDDPASRGSAVRRRTRAKAADQVVAAPEPTAAPQQQEAQDGPSSAVTPTASSLSNTERLRMYEAFCEASKAMMQGR